MAYIQYGLTRKQCGVIFKLWKDGKITVTEETINWMYKHVSEKSTSWGTYRTCLEEAKRAFDYAISGEYEEASEWLANAHKLYACNYAEK